MLRSQIRLLRTKSLLNNKRTIKNSYGGNFKIARLCSLVFYLRVTLSYPLTPVAERFFKTYLARIFRVSVSSFCEVCSAVSPSISLARCDFFGAFFEKKN